MVGLALERSVEKTLKKKFKEPNFDVTQSSQVNLNLSPRRSHFRVKIVEIEVKDNGIFIKTIPYKDRKMQKEELNFNVEGEIQIIKNLVKSISKSLYYEKIDVF